MRKQEQLRRFEQEMLPHLDSAYRLAHWLTRNEDDAEDIVQEAYLRAFRFFEKWHGTDSRPWLFTILRNTYYSWIRQTKQRYETLPLDDEQNKIENTLLDPETLILQQQSVQLIREALERLPLDSREVLVLRELEDFSYKEISQILNIPLGTVMSRLARARKRLQRDLMAKEQAHELL